MTGVSQEEATGQKKALFPPRSGTLVHQVNKIGIIQLNTISVLTESHFLNPE
jgi:hypothetical protein